MEHDTALVATVAAGLGLAFVLGFLAARLRLPPLVGYLLAAEKLRAPLDALRVWLAKENAVIMAVLLLVIGVNLIGKGIAAF